MNEEKKIKLNVSHAPFWHNKNEISYHNYNIISAIIPSFLIGIIYYGISALGVVSLSISSAMIWEIIFKKISKREITIHNGHSALTGLLLGILLPASAPWWLVIVGTFIAIIMGIEIFGGIGNNPFNPVALSLAILTTSWDSFLDLNESLINFNLNFVSTMDPLVIVKYFGTSASEVFSFSDLLLGKHVSTIGSGCSIAIILGGIYLISKNIIRWEISLSYLVSVFLTAYIFNILNPLKYATPEFHLLTGFTMIGIFFLSTDNSSSPVNSLSMIIYGFTAGVLTILIRNIGSYTEGVIFAILIVNLINPIIDKIRHKAIGKVI